MFKIKGIIFDMDGVLVDAKEWHYEALNKALDKFGFIITREEHLTNYDGLTTRTKLKMLTAEKGLPIELHQEVYNLKQKYTIDIAKEKCMPFKEHLYALAKLRQDGFKLAVASNAIRNSVSELLTRTELIHFIQFFLSNQDVLEPKPNSEIYDTAIERLGLRPDECLVLEDNINGITSAKSAGAHVLIIKTIDDVTYENIFNKIEYLEKDLDGAK